jgi:hypothetical protein
MEKLQESSEVNQEVFKDRRKAPENIREVIDGEIIEWNRRRDDNLRFKLEAIEKYFDLAVKTRADALHIAVSRMQGDASACFNRCTHQVALFYEEINALKESVARNDERFKALIIADRRVVKVNDGLFKKVETNYKGLEERFSALEDWKNMNWKQSLIWGVVAIIAGFKILDWLSKMIHFKPTVP